MLIDHAFVIAGGEITKSDKNWLGGKLDTSKRSQVLFMDRDNILSHFIVINLPLPASAVSKENLSDPDDLPF